MKSEQVKILSGEITLAGTLCAPQTPGPHPVVLLIHGSGPLDRDVNTTGIKLNIFNTMAEVLARKGFATLRYDKRGRGKSGGKYYSAGHFDLVEDATACANFLAARNEFSNLYLLGHSEGTLIAPQVAARLADPAGMVLVCPLIDTIETVLIDQAGQMERAIANEKGFQAWVARLFTSIFGSPTKTQKKLVARVKKSTKPVIWLGLARLPARWLRELMAIQPRKLFAKVTIPTFLVGAQKDIQCKPGDGAEIAALIGDKASFTMIDDLTHILRKDPGEHTFFSYKALFRQPMDTEVIEVISDWLSAQEEKAKQERPVGL
ncbi:MAG: alpha/beta hydrolase [Alphaproteobacteria bacterium]|nr:alpha/beta hydrolase [Alphaproteobacteria bacterium]